VLGSACEHDLDRVAAALRCCGGTAARRRAATEPRSWEGFLNSSGNPNIPTVGEAIEQVLTTTEREQFTTYLRPLVAQGLGEWRMATAHIAATKRPSAAPE
jgi:uncharacterized protein YfaQ (DUF2300 family)